MDYKRIMMQKLTKDEINATHRIFNHVNELNNGYYGHKTVNEAKKFVSQNRWIMFPVYNVPSLREGATFPAPNVYIAFYDDDISAHSNGRTDGWIGLTYGNTESMLWLGDILRKKNISYFINNINILGSGWIVSIDQKIKTNFQDNTPVYRNISQFDTHIVIADDIKKAISASNADLIKQGEFYNNEIVLWCVTIFSVIKETKVMEFDNDIKSIFDLFIKVLSLR